MAYNVTVNINKGVENCEELANLIAQIIQNYTGAHPHVQINNRYKKLKNINRKDDSQGKYKYE